MDLRDASASKNTLYLDIKLHEYLDFCHRNCPKLEILSLRVVGKPWYLSNLRFYVSKIKEQHKKLHSAEQILRAELAEKRQVLKGLRKVKTYFEKLTLTNNHEQIWHQQSWQVLKGLRKVETGDIFQKKNDSNNHEQIWTNCSWGFF